MTATADMTHAEMQAHHGELAAHARRFTDGHTAEDVASEAVTRVWMQEQRETIRNPGALAFIVTRRLCIDIHRHRMTRQCRGIEIRGRGANTENDTPRGYSVTNLASVSDDPVERAEVADHDARTAALSDALAAAVARLPPAPRAVVELLAEGVDLPTVAARLGLSDTATRVRAFRGRRRLLVDAQLLDAWKAVNP